MKKILTTTLSILVLLLGLFYGTAGAADFIVPNTGGEPITFDVSNLSKVTDIDVTVGEFTEQPRVYRNENTNTLVFFPTALTDSEQVVQVRSGGQTITKTVSFRSSPDGDLRGSLLPQLKVSRAGHTLTKISDGRVVIAGGSKRLIQKSLKTVEIFNPETGSTELLVTPDGSKRATLASPRSHHTATYLGINEEPIGMITGPVEQILIVGGFQKNGQILKTLEILEIKVGTNQAVSTKLSGKNRRLKKARLFHTASLLPNGRVLIVGGQGRINMSNIGALNSIEIFDPVGQVVLPSPVTLSTPRLLHTATTLQDGNILIVGGFTNGKPNQFEFGPATDKAELIDTKNLTIKSVGLLDNLEGIGGHSATLLPNGLVLITGGSRDFFSGRTGDEFRGLTTGKIQFYNPLTQSFAKVKDINQGDLTLTTSRFLHDAVLLPNGDVAVIGGLNIKAGTSSEVTINTPLSTIEVIKPNIDLFTVELEGEHKSVIKTSEGRFLSRSILVTPKDKTSGFLTGEFSDNFVNSAIFVSGGFTNGAGSLPTKLNELYHIVSNKGIEGRDLTIFPEGVITGGFLENFSVSTDVFSEVPALRVEPQTVNLSISNSFMAEVMILSANNETTLLKAEGEALGTSVIVSPSLFEVGDTVTISRTEAGVTGEFDIRFIPANVSDDFIPADLKIHIADSAKPFLATVPGNGISLSNQAGKNTKKVKLKVFSEDGVNELTTIPPSTNVTATVEDPSVANLGGTGISSVVGTLLTEFTVNALKPGKTQINFDIDFPDVLSVSIPLEVSGTPSFSSSPIDADVIANLASNGISVSGVNRIEDTNILLENIRISPTKSLFPVYVPVNLISSIDGSAKEGLFTIRSVFGVDLHTANPRTLVTNLGTKFRPSIFDTPLVIGGIVPVKNQITPFAILASNSDIRSLNFNSDIEADIDEIPKKISNTGNIRDLELLESDGKIHLIAIKDSKLLILDGITGEVETTISLTGRGHEVKLTKIDGKDAAVVAVGTSGVDLVFPLIGGGTKVVNFQLGGITEHISVVEKLGGETGPFVVAFDEINTISITNLQNVSSSIDSFLVGNERINKIAYAGRFLVSGKVTDVLIATAGRKVLLFDLNNRASISLGNKLDIRTKIMDLVVIDGVAYLALGNKGILAVSIGALIDPNASQAEITNFTKHKIVEVRANGIQRVKTKKITSQSLANASPFLLSTGSGNDLTVIRVAP